MKLLNSELLWLLPLIAVPILIHILIRQRLPRVRWAAMTFLMRALRKNRRRLLLETILLLIVRTAIVAAIVFVVLRPVARAGWQWLSGQRQRTVSIIVLDDSASMAASDGVRTRMDRAIVRIEEYLDQLPAGSDVAVMLAADPPADLIRQPTRDISYVRQTLSKLAPRDSASAIEQSLITAAERLREEKTPNREIVIVTDGQAAGWQDDDARKREAFATAGEMAEVFVLAVPQTPAGDAAVTDLTISGGPDALTPSLAATLWPTSISVRLTALNTKEPLDTGIDLFVDGRKVTRKQVRVPPDQDLIISFEHRFNSPGEHTIAARCDSDLYERNNQRSMLLKVRERINVLLVDGRPGHDPAMSAGGFIRIALWPTDPQEPESVSFFDVRTLSTGNLESVQIGSFPLIILADVPALPSAAIGQIKAAVRDGSGLLIIAGPQVNASNLAAMFFEGGSGLLPVQLGPPIDLQPTDPPVGLVLNEPLVPALSAFDDPILMRALSTATFQTVRPVASVQGKNVQTWARFTRGGAALVANTFGQGGVVYFGGSADRQGGEFPLSPAFVPFFQQLAFHLTFGQDVPQQPAGQALEWHLATTDGINLTYPDGTSTPADAMVAEDPATGQPRVLLPSAQLAGVYTLTYNDATGTPRQAKKAVNLHADEFDPAMLALAPLREKQALAKTRVIGPADSIRTALLAAKREAELSTTGIIILLILLATELLLVRLFAPRQVDTQAMLKKAMDL
ncbi:MAG: VWA domain-containing protein [Phycisphaerae bacterium]|nr:VWA domain-containing protein [Phycisphaerae bacterium]